MLMFILSSIEDDIINAYNNYKLIKANVVSLEYYSYHLGNDFNMEKKNQINAYGNVVFDMQNEKVEYNLISQKKGEFQIYISIDENKRIFDGKLIYKNKLEMLGEKFSFLAPYYTLKYLLSNGFEHQIQHYLDEIIITFTMPGGKQITFILKSSDYSITMVEYIVNPFGITNINILFDNIQIIQ